jgi:anti-sigma B factor antagonist
MLSTCNAQIVPAIETGGLAAVILTGEVDGSAKDVLPAAYDKAVAVHEPTTVRLDFHGVDYINSTGIAVIVSVLAKARAEGRIVAAAGLTAHYRHIFTITRLVDFMQVLDAETPATT